MKLLHIHLVVNDKEYLIDTPPNRTLLDILRQDLGLTGVKQACAGTGECGACMVIMNGKATNSCLVLAGQADGAQITTIEGLSVDGELHPLQRSFAALGNVQCGFCTPGMIMAAKALLDHNPAPSPGQIKEALSGNLCRCTGYTHMVDAVQQAAREMQDEI